MTFFDFLDRKYRSLNLQLQMQYTISKDAEVKGAYQLIQVQRTLLKWFWMPVLFLNYVLINIGLAPQPQEPVRPTQQTVETAVPETTTPEGSEEQAKEGVH